MTITEFLEARISEDEAAARQASQWSAVWDRNGTWWLEGVEHDVVGGEEVYCHPHNADHIARHDPARGLAECAAKRAIIGEHEPVDYSSLGMTSPNACNLCGVDKGMNDWEWVDNSFPCATLQALAAVYASHPDYQQEWAL